jgi:hypothetical protein
VKIEERELIIVVDKELTMFLFDYAKLKHEIGVKGNQNLDHREHALAEINLIENCRYFEHSFIKQEETNSMIND